MLRAAQSRDGRRLTITGVDVAHDDSGGGERGKNTIVVLDDGDVRLAHLGDLGHLLDAETAEGSAGSTFC